MDDQGEIRDDVKVPDSDLGKEITEKSKDADNQFLVTILKAIGEEQAIAIKNMPKWLLGKSLVEEWIFPLLILQISHHHNINHTLLLY